MFYFFPNFMAEPFYSDGVFANCSTGGPTLPFYSEGVCSFYGDSRGSNLALL